MDTFMADHTNKRWSSDIEAYKRYASLYPTVSNPHVRGIIAKSCKRIRGYWPTQQAVFDMIDREVGK